MTLCGVSGASFSIRNPAPSDRCFAGGRQQRSEKGGELTGVESRHGAAVYSVDNECARARAEYRRGRRHQEKADKTKGYRVLASLRTGNGGGTGFGCRIRPPGLRALPRRDLSGRQVSG